MYGTEFILPSSAQVLSMSLKFETPSTKAAEGVFSVSIILIALVVPCDQNLLGRRSFDSVGRALRPKS